MTVNKKLVVIIGPSGCGKSTLAKELVGRFNVNLIPIFTERPKRSPDESSPEHKFLDKNQMDQVIENEEYLFCRRAFGLQYRYAIPRFRLDDGKLNIMLLREDYIEGLKKYFSDIIVVQIEAPFEFAKNNLLKRSGEVGDRLDRFQEEVDKGRQFADMVFVNDTTVDELVDKVHSSLIA